MSIEVVYENGRKGFVTPEMLDYLLETGGIICFKRSNGWVRPACDPVRSRGMVFFSIPERRSAMNELLESDSPLPLGEPHPD